MEQRVVRLVGRVPGSAGAGAHVVHGQPTTPMRRLVGAQSGDLIGHPRLMAAMRQIHDTESLFHTAPATHRREE